MIESTIRNVAVLNLLEDFGPDGCVTSPVGLDGGGLEVDYLGDTTDHFVMSCLVSCFFGLGLGFVMEIRVFGCVGVTVRVWLLWFNLQLELSVSSEMVWTIDCLDHLYPWNWRPYLSDQYP